MAGFYPTHIGATAASRAAFGLSANAVVSSAVAEFSEILGKPFSPQGSASFDAALKKALSQSTGMSSYYPRPTAMGQMPLKGPGPGFPSMAGPSLRPTPPPGGSWGFPKLPPLGGAAWGALRGMNAASWALAAAMAAAELARRARAAQEGRIGAPGDWEWPDPTDPVYDQDSTAVIVCGGENNATHGPYANGGICGVLGDGDPELGQGVLHSYELTPSGLTSIEHWEWELRQYLNHPVSNIYSPAVEADYWIIESPPAPETDPEDWPVPEKGSGASFADEPGRAPDAPAMVDPMSQPVADPMPSPTPVPLPMGLQHLKVPNPYRAPSERSENGYEEPQTGSAGAMEGDDPPKPPRPHWPPRRPRKDEKEKKLSARQQAALSAAFFFTEVDDVVQSLWEALPDHRQEGRGTWARAQDLYQHWDEVDFEEALWNLWANQVEDAIIGAISGLDTKAHKKLSALLPGNKLGIHPGRGLI